MISENISNHKNQNQKSLFRIFFEIVAVWTVANIGYYTVIPYFGFQISYNSSPIAISIYFFLWSVFCAIYFREVYLRKFRADSRIWLYGFLSLASALLLFGLVKTFSLMPELYGPILSTYTDLVLATPWYFLPKALEILVQQLLLTVLIIELASKFHTLQKVVFYYLLAFAGAHILQFYISSAPAQYAVVFTISAMLSAFVFPYLILRIRGGFIYVYMIHFLFYILLSIVLHVFPPPGYFI